MSQVFSVLKEVYVGGEGLSYNDAFIEAVKSVKLAGFKFYSFSEELLLNTARDLQHTNGTFEAQYDIGKLTSVSGTYKLFTVNAHVERQGKSNLYKVIIFNPVIKNHKFNDLPLVVRNTIAVSDAVSEMAERVG